MELTRREVLESTLAGPIALQHSRGEAQTPDTPPASSARRIDPQALIVGDAASLYSAAWPIVLASFCEGAIAGIRAQLEAVDSGLAAGIQAGERALCGIITVDELLRLRARGSLLQALVVLPPPLGGSGETYVLAATPPVSCTPLKRARLELVAVSIVAGTAVARHHRTLVASLASQKPRLLPHSVAKAMTVGPLDAEPNEIERWRNAVTQVPDARHRRAAEGAFAAIAVRADRRMMGWLAASIPPQDRDRD